MPANNGTGDKLAEKTFKKQKSSESDELRFSGPVIYEIGDSLQGEETDPDWKRKVQLYARQKSGEDHSKIRKRPGGVFPKKEMKRHQRDSANERDALPRREAMRGEKRKPGNA